MIELDIWNWYTKEVEGWKESYLCTSISYSNSEGISVYVFSLKNCTLEIVKLKKKIILIKITVSTLLI